MRNRAWAIVGLLVCTLALSAAWAQAAEAYGLSVSSQATRASAVTLGGQTYQQSSVIHVFVAPTSGVRSVSFYLDNPTRTGPPRRTENVAAYDFNGTASNGNAIGYSMSGLSSGSHTITASVLKTNGQTEVHSGTFTVQSGVTGQSTLLFADEFNGSSVNTANWYQYNGTGHAGHGLRRPAALSVSNGSLVITAKMVSGKIQAGGMSHRQNYTYGRYEFRVRTEADPTGTMSGIAMTWPKYQWSPQFTENDVYETGYSVSRRPFRTFIHYGTSNSQKYYIHNADASEWHTMVMDWRPNALKIYRDGALVWQTTETAVIPDVAHHVALQLDARFTRTLSTQVRMYVDYVRIYR